MRQALISLTVVLAVAGCNDPVPPADGGQVAEKAVMVTPSETTYTGEGETVEKEVRAWRVMSPFGMSPAEMISHVKAYEAKGGEAPGVNVGPGGVSTTEASRGSLKDSGLSWTLWDSIKSFLRSVMWWGIGLGAVLLALFLIPATQPIASTILRGLAAVVPIVGSVVERIVARFQWQKPLEQTVRGVEAVKAGKPPEQRQGINDALKTAQDAATQAAVRAIKAKAGV